MIEWKKLREEYLEIIRQWRMREDITRGMYTDPFITPEEQQQWYKQISDDPTQMYWVTVYDGEPIGLVSLSSINQTHKSCQTGGYIAEERGFAAVIANEYGLLKVAFDVLGMNRVQAEVLSNNMRIVKMHELEGYTTEGVLRQAICKQGMYYDIYIQSMLREEWLAGKMRYQSDVVIEL